MSPGNNERPFPTFPFRDSARPNAEVLVAHPSSCPHGKTPCESSTAQHGGSCLCTKHVRVGPTTREHTTAEGRGLRGAPERAKSPRPRPRKPLVLCRATGAEMVTGAVEHHWARPRGCAVMNGEGRRALAYINTAQLKEPAGPFCPAPRLVISDAPITGGMPGSTSDQLSLGSFPWPMPTHLGSCADGGVSPHWQAQPGKASVTGITTCTNTDTPVTPRPQGEARDGRGAMTSGPIGSPTHSRGEDTGRSGI